MFRMTFQMEKIKRKYRVDVMFKHTLESSLTFKQLNTSNNYLINGADIVEEIIPKIIVIE